MDAEQLEGEVRLKMRQHAALRHVPGKHRDRALLHAEIDVWLDRYLAVVKACAPTPT